MGALVVDLLDDVVLLELGGAVCAMVDVELGLVVPGGRERDGEDWEDPHAATRRSRMTGGAKATRLVVLRMITA